MMLLFHCEKLWPGFKIDIIECYHNNYSIFQVPSWISYLPIEFLWNYANVNYLETILNDFLFIFLLKVHARI